MRDARTRDAAIEHGWNTIWGSPRDILGSPEMIDPSVGPVRKVRNYGKSVQFSSLSLSRILFLLLPELLV